MLQSIGHRVSCAKDGEEAQALIERHVFDVAIFDVNMPHVSGIVLARRLRLQSPTTAVVVMTAQGTVRDVVDVMRGGAIEFLTKPFDPAMLEERVLRPIDERFALRKEFDEALARRTEQRTGSRVVATGPKMRALVDWLAVAAQDDAPMLLLGEPGTGKKTLARFVHERSPRRDGPFVVVACSSLPSMMVEAELHALAAGASAAERDAWFRSADGGTIVLDGVDALPHSAQASLIRVLTEPDSLARRDEKRRPRGVRIVATASEGAMDSRAERRLDSSRCSSGSRASSPTCRRCASDPASSCRSPSSSSRGYRAPRRRRRSSPTRGSASATTPSPATCPSSRGRFSGRCSWRTRRRSARVISHRVSRGWRRRSSKGAGPARVRARPSAARRTFDQRGAPEPSDKKKGGHVPYAILVDPLVHGSAHLFLLSRIRRGDVKRRTEVGVVDPHRQRRQVPEAKPVLVVARVDAPVPQSFVSAGSVSAA